LIPVANPKTSQALIDFGAMVAKEKDGELILMNAITVPQQSPLEVGRQYIKNARDRVIDEALEMAQKHDVPTSSIIRIARKPAKAIIDEVEDRDIDMVVMGWQGKRRSPETRLGSNIDQVMKDADCDIAVLRGKEFSNVKNIFIPIAYPDQAHLMLEVGQMFEKEQQSNIDLYHIISPRVNDDEEAKQRRLNDLYEGLADLKAGPDSEEEAKHAIKLTVDTNIVGSIVDLSSQHDLTIIGAAREGWFHKLIAGTKPEQIAQRTDGNLILIKNRRTTIHSGLLDVIEFFRSSEPDRAQ